MPTFKLTGPAPRQTLTIEGTFEDAMVAAARLLAVDRASLVLWSDDDGDNVTATEESPDVANVTIHECTGFLCESEQWVGKASKAESTFDSVEQFLSYCQTVFGCQPDLYESCTGEWCDRNDGHALVLVAA